MAPANTVEASEREATALMQLLHYMDAASAGRETMELDLRARRVVQVLGLSGPIPTVAVAQRLGISPSTMTGLTDRLERAGYIERRPHETDRRATILALTGSGKRLFAREKRFYSRLIDEVLAPLDTEEKRLVLKAMAQLQP
jgi:DNA-binding MarR family transcriptional regulator